MIPVVKRKPHDQGGFGWESPRWRLPDAPAQHVDEAEQRFRDTPAPQQRGAIDDHRTIARGERPSETSTPATSEPPGALPATPSTANVSGEPSNAAAVHEQARTIRTVFAQASDGYTAVGRLRATGFRIDLAGSVDGDLIVSIQASRARYDELAAIVAAHQGKIETEPHGAARQRQDWD